MRGSRGMIETFERRLSSLVRVGFLTGWIGVSAILGTPAIAADDDGEAGGTPAWLEPPGWVDRIGIAGRYAGTVGGSESKYLEDHNIQSGPIFSLGIQDEITRDGMLSIEGMLEPLQDQGFLILDFSQAERVHFNTDIQAWREYYNTRTGEADETVLGRNLSSFFPNSNNSTHFFGGGKPRADWLRTRTGIAIDLPGPFSRISADFVYRRVRGEMSLLKGGTVFDALAVPPVVSGSGPGTVFFDISSRKQIDYETFGGIFATRSTLGNVNWQFDASGMSHELKSTVNEANFGTDAASSELERFGRDTSLKIVNGELVASRHLRPDLFVFGGTSFSWERSDPDPFQSVQTGIRSVAPVRVLTRRTLGSDVIRFSEAVTGGAVFTPLPNVIVRAKASVRASQQEASLNENRDESGFLAGDIGTIANDSKRNVVSTRVRLKADWRAARRLSISGLAQYDLRYDNVRSSRILNFAAVEAPEIEDYTNQRSQARAGLTGRYRFRRGRTLEGGYEFTWVGFENDINTLANQFIVADYERLRHRIHVKAAGRISRKLRGEIRAQYVFESRTLDAPNVQPPDITAGGDGDIEYQGFTITPVLTYQHDPHWSGVLSASISRHEYKLVDDGPAPAGFSSRFAGFEFESLTETVTLGVNWVPSDRFSGGVSYTVYANTESVENVGHDALVRSTFALDENWDMNGSVRYLGFTPGDDNTVDDYHTVIVSLGLVGRF